MTRWIGHASPERELQNAVDSGKLHHAWILAGHRGLGKAHFALAAAHWLLDHGDAEKTASLIAAGSHPDLKLLRRLPKDSFKDEDGPPTEADLRRIITVDQIRKLGASLATRPSIANRRVVIIDSVDDLDREGANALLKNLEEPPAGTLFLCISHAPGRLLPTIRSRCQMLRFEPLSDGDMEQAIRQAIPDVTDQELKSLIAAGSGSPGNALSFAGLEVGKLDQAMAAIAHDGDRDNRQRAELARDLSLKASHGRYEAFLRRVPSFIAAEARTAPLAKAPNYLSAWEEANKLSHRALPLNIDKQSTVLEMGRILSSLAPTVGAGRG